MPVQRAQAARNDGSHVCCGRLAGVAEDWLSFVSLLEEIGQFLVAILPPVECIRILNRDVFLGSKLT